MADTDVLERTDEDEDEDELDEEAAAAAAAVAALAVLIGDDVEAALAEQDEERRDALLAALAVTAFTLAYQAAGGTGSSIEAARSYARGLRPAIGLLQPDGSDAQAQRMTDLIAHSATTAATIAVTVDDAGPAGPGPDGPPGDLRFEWRTQRDDRVRDMHRPVDGQLRAAGEPFDVGGHPQRYPGHPIGPPEAWINCRCFLIPRVTTVTAGGDMDETPDEWTAIHDGVITAASDKPWGQFSASDYTIEQWRRACILTMPGGDPESKSTYKLPIREPGGALNVNGVHAAASRFGQTQAPADAKAAAKAKLRGAYKQIGEQVPESLSADATIARCTNPDCASSATSHSPQAQRSAADSVIPPAKNALDHSVRTPLNSDSARTTPSRDARLAGSGGTRNAAAPSPGSKPANSPSSSDSDAPSAVTRSSSTSATAGTVTWTTAMPLVVSGASSASAATRASGPSGRTPSSSPPLCDICGSELKADASDDSLQAWPKSTSPPGTHDAPGWITNPRETQRLRTYWTKGAGAAKIGWGSPGDLTRCAKFLGKYVGPQYAWGTCQNLHHTVFGKYNPESRGRHGGGDPDEIIDAIDAAFTAAAQLEDDMDTPTALAPPLEWFQDPGFDAATPLTITSDGRVLGHLASWDTCHVGITGECVKPPRSNTGYAHFRLGEVETAEGELVAVGQITMDTGHAGQGDGPNVAIAHYDDTGTAVADVAAGEDDHGIWVAGAMRPGVSEEQMYNLKATGKLSGDWRRIGGNLELVAALAVNVPGYPIPRVEMAASAGRTLSLVAAAVVTADPNALDAERVAVAVLARLDQREADKQRERRAVHLIHDIAALRAEALTAGLR